ncbi:hypothetical protein ALC53_08752 [Atta colombica]|uniref:Uncharacterized protein n=1 Tax=Atta colombica TaxID=520822 RepID=A0A195B8B7_9HYME|nr:hypothetical protein ALC53_08752 [Atta colombica]
MQLDVECKTTPMADAMLLQLLKGQQMKLDATFTKALVKQIECNILKISIEVWRDYLKECNYPKVYYPWRATLHVYNLHLAAGCSFYLARSNIGYIHNAFRPSNLSNVKQEIMLASVVMNAKWNTLRISSVITPCSRTFVNRTKRSEAFMNVLKSRREFMSLGKFGRFTGVYGVTLSVIFRDYTRKDVEVLENTILEKDSAVGRFGQYSAPNARRQNAGKGDGTKSPLDATRKWVARTEMRVFSPSFSPFTHTTAAGNGIANPSTLHASWQLVISRPVLRQHTPRYVSLPHRVVVLVAPPSTQEYPLDLTKWDVRTKRTGYSPDLAHPCSHKWSFVMIQSPSARVEFLESQADCTRTSFVLSVALDGAKLRIL